MSDQDWVAPGSGAPQERPAWTPAAAPAPPPSFPGQPPAAAPPGHGPPSYGPPPGHGPPPGYAGGPPAYGPPPGLGPPPGYAGGPPAYGPPGTGQRLGAGPLPPGARPPGPPAWQRAGLEFRPGIIPLRPLQIGDLYGGVIKAVRGNAAATMGLAALTTIVFLVPCTAIGAWLGSQSRIDATADGDVMPVGMFGQYVPVFGTWLSSILLTGFMSYVIGQAVMGRKVSPGETFRGTMSRVLSLVGATLLIALVSILLVGGIGVGIVIMVVGLMSGDTSDTSGAVIAVGVIVIIVAALATIVLGLGLQTLFAFTMPAVVLERVDPATAIRRSWSLVGPPNRKGFWRILGLRILTSLIVGTVAQIIAIPLAMVGFGLMFVGGIEQAARDMFMWQAVIQGVVAIVTGALTTPFIAGVDALLYVDARIRSEALDVQLIRAQQGERAPWESAAR